MPICRKLAQSLAFNDEVYAVIGGLYSSNAAILAAELTLVGKTFFTLATTEQLVRAYASTGYLWAMTETDITQCEVLLSKVITMEVKAWHFWPRIMTITGRRSWIGSHFRHANSG